MNRNSLIKLTNSNTNQDVYINALIMFGTFYAEAHKSTVVIANGGALVPVSESVEDVITKWQEVLAEPKEGEE